MPPLTIPRDWHKLSATWREWGGKRTMTRGHGGRDGKLYTLANIPGVDPGELAPAATVGEEVPGGAATSADATA